MTTTDFHWRAAAFCLLLCARGLLPGATLTVTSMANSGNGTLRQALLNANTNANLDTIVFNISGSGVKTVSPTAALPRLTSPVIIDGTTQPGYTGVTPLIEINGTSAGPAFGLEVLGGGSLIKGLTINRFQFAGIWLATNGNNVVERCFIGTDSTGTAARGNGFIGTYDGITAFYSAGNLIGGTSANAGNVISGNARYGVGLAGNLSRSNRVEGNFIGTDLLGLAPVPNRDGVGVVDAPRNTIGGADLAARNIISGNTEDGIELGGAGAVGNVVVKNMIGLDPTGQAPLPNGQNGILISTHFQAIGPASGTIIGGTRMGNGISGNGRDGIQMGFGTTSNQVTGNALGSSQDGLVLVPNGRHGVSIFDSTNNAVTIGGGSPNYIIGNRSNGVFIGRGALNTGSVSNRVEGNYIATNGLDGIQLSGGANGNQVRANLIGGGQGLVGAILLGNARHGVAILDSMNNIIGGPAAIEWNTISGNRSNGVFLGKGVLGSGSFSNAVQGNRIGHSQMGNGGSGVFVQGSGNLIGGFAGNEGNTINFNGSHLLQRGHGVVIDSGTKNAIVGNLFRGNAGRAIDLGNDSFTVNDIQDVDDGANDRQNYPVVTRVAFHPAAGIKEITWTLNSRPLGSYYLEFFSNTAPDNSGFGEGQKRLASRDVFTDNDGMAEVTVPFPLTEDFISATATDVAARNTSEFSPVDTDGDAIADAWETQGIDFNEDGTVDLVLAGANPMAKDVYVEIDAMIGRAPDMNNLNRINTGRTFPADEVVSGTNVYLSLDYNPQNDGFFYAPAELVQNPDGSDGVEVHLELDETYLPLSGWGALHFSFFDVLKQNFYGTVGQRANLNALAAKRLIYRYCIFADSVPDAGGAARATGASDFFVAVGVRSSDPTDDVVPGAFMHELGHSLGLPHGGSDDINFKANYHSIMNYAWVCPGGRNTPWRLDFSREAFATLNETDLDESVGIGASSNHAGHMVLVGPYLVGQGPVTPRLVPEVGPVDWDEDGTPGENHVARNINFLSGFLNLPNEILQPSEDWSKLRYYFLDNPYTNGLYSSEFTNDLDPAILDAFEKLGTGPGHLQFSAPFYTVGEIGTVATVTITRVFEAEATVTVGFSMLGGTAQAGVDYVSTNGIVTFTGSESTKTVAIPILNDGAGENPETVQLILSNPTGGATLGSRREATLIIIDDDPPGRFTVGHTNNSGAGSLRQALLDANAAPGLAIIEFNIPGTSGLTISPASALPTITNRITIDGATQPGFSGTPMVELSGASAGANVDGLRISAGRCTVRGLVINRFGGNGINLLTAGQNRIEGCYIGLSRQGTLAQGNNQAGIFIQSSDNIIGGLALAARNFISGNLFGVTIFGATNEVLGNVVGLGVNGSDQGNILDGLSVASRGNTIGGLAAGSGNVISGNDQDGIGISADENRVLGNLIGTDLAGLASRRNGRNGVAVSFSRGNVIGGAGAGAGNVISGNARRGIDLNSATATVMLGNRIGTDVSGQVAIPNLQGGVLLNFSSQGNRIGDTLPRAANTIAFNNGPGVFLSSEFASNNVIRGNTVFSNAGPGIDLFFQGVTLNDTNDTDTGANQLQNFPVLASASNSVAGTTISGTLNSRPNTTYTIDFYANGTEDNSGWGEGQFWIGSAAVTSDSAGHAAFSAASPAIYLRGRFITATATDPAGNTSEFSRTVLVNSVIPGRTFTVENVNDSGAGSLRQAFLDSNAFQSERNSIAFNIPGFGVQTIAPLAPLPGLSVPVLIDGYTQPGSSPNTALTGHNGVLLIELNGALAGSSYGLYLAGGNSIVRGLVLNRFGNSSQPIDAGAILVHGLGGSRIEGNFIGTDPTGFLARTNLFYGVHLLGSSSNVVGGTTPAARNVISGIAVVGTSSSFFSSGDAVALSRINIISENPSGNRIEGNLLGTAADGITPLGNQGSAVRFLGPNDHTTIGGTVPEAGNIIAFNGSAAYPSISGGVRAFSVDGGTAILGNSIHSNFGPGIHGDLVNTSSGRGNFPFLGSAIVSHGTTTVQGRLQSVSNAAHRIELFANDVLEPLGHGEGRRFLGWTNVLTDANGFTAFMALIPSPVTNGQFLTATATDDQNNTSEFAPRLAVGDVLTNVIVVNSANDVDDGVANATHTSLREALLAANNHAGPDRIHFAMGSGARTINSTSNALPAVMDPVTLDATTQPGYAGQPLIYLDGLLQQAVAFRLYAPSNTVRGFAINRFGRGIYGDGRFASPFGGYNNIEGNYLGTDRAGLTSGGQGVGINFVFGCHSNRIGGISAAARNLISGNTGAGISLTLSSYGNVILGNFIGTDLTGTNQLGNMGVAGVYVQDGRGTVIGGVAPGSRNVISGNHPWNLVIESSPATIVRGNFIGTDVTGGRILGGGDCLRINGDLSLIQENVLAGFSTGILLDASACRIEGNFIGTDVTGTRALGLGTGIIVAGIRTANVIGGTNAGTRNVISACVDGVTLACCENSVQGNFIGTQSDGVSPLGNIRDGVILQGSSNVIGGFGAGNVIAFNGGKGISVSSSATNNALLGNSIFSNTGLGIDLDPSGVATNDPGDIDTGANALQNFPILSAARNTGAGTLLQGTLNSRPHASYRIEFFSNNNCHPSGQGEGRRFLSATSALTDAGGNAAFAFNHPTPVSPGQFVTATATDPNQNTSEFSPCVAVFNDTNYVIVSFTRASPYTLSWPVWALNYSLERTTNLAPPVVWQVISNGIVTNAESKLFVVTNVPASPAMFFRLRRP